MSSSLPEPDFAQVARAIPKHGRIVVHSAFAEPSILIERLLEHIDQLDEVTVHNMMPFAVPKYAAPEIAKRIHVESFFPGPGLRKAVNQGLVGMRRCALSDIPGCFGSGELKTDLLLLQVSRPNADGEVSLGISVDYMLSVIAQRPIVVAQINANMPFTLGAAVLHVDQLDYVLAADTPLQELPLAAPDAVDKRIAEHVAGLIDDGDIVQAGIGALPDAVLGGLQHHKSLGAHTGILTGAWRPLLEADVVDNSTKKEHRGLSVCTMAGGDEAFYRYLDRNRAIRFEPIPFTHGHASLINIDKLCSINGALQVDLQGNVNAETVGGRIISNPGGMPDFTRGAHASRGGKSIITLRSSFKDGQRSNIVSNFANDAPITVGGRSVDYVVTEYGVAELRDKDASDRAVALIAIAHPDHREPLERAARGS